MSLSLQRATSNGTMVSLALSIDYFTRSDITVFIGGVLKAPGSGWNWVGTTDKTISFSPAVANGVEVLVKRSTDLTAPRHEYTKGAQFVSETLDENFRQSLYAVQEAKEGSVLSEVFNDLDMHTYAIRNVGTATNPGDAVSLGQYQADAAGASAAKVAAQASQADALASKNAAATSEANALASKNAAATSATNAATSETNALASKNAAATSAQNAATSESNALTSKNSAATSLANFQNQYQGPLASAPATRKDNSALQIGDLYFDTATGMRVYTAQGWASAGSSVNGTAKRGSIVATDGQTVFPIPGGFDPGFIDVYLDGSKLVNATDVTVNASPNVTLVQGARAGQTLDYVAYGTFNVANTYDQATIDAKVNQQQFRNRIINGCLRVDQRGSAVSTVSAQGGVPFTYFADRFYIGTNLNNRFNMLKEGTTSLPSAKFVMYAGVTTGVTLSASDYSAIYHIIEGLNVQDSLWGTAGAKAATLTFWAYATTAGTYSGAINSYQSTMSYPFTFTVATANTWVPITVSIPGCTTGTWKFDNTQGIQIVWNLGTGSTFLAPSGGAWSAANYVGVSGSVQLATLSGHALRIGQVQFEFASTATPFEVRPYPVELLLCQRYYETGVSDILTGTHATGINYGTRISFNTMKRVSPTITTTRTYTFNCSATSTPLAVGVQGFGLYASSTAVGSMEAADTWYANAEL